jgi:hypothetical protein
VLFKQPVLYDIGDEGSIAQSGERNSDETIPSRRADTGLPDLDDEHADDLAADQDVEPTSRPRTGRQDPGGGGGS